MLAVVALLAMVLALGNDRHIVQRRLTSTEPFVGSVEVGPNPVGVALDNQTKRAFVLSRGPLNQLDEPTESGTVTVTDTQTGANVYTARVGLDPSAVAVAERSGRVFVVNRGGSSAQSLSSQLGSVSVLDSSTGRVLHSAVVGVAPQAIAIDERSGRVVVANRGATPERGCVSILDDRQGTLLGEIEVDVYPAAVAVDSSQGLVFVANMVSNTVSVLDLQQMRLVRTIVLGDAPGTVARLAMDERTGLLVALSFPARVTGGGPTDGEVTLIAAQNGRITERFRLPNPTALTVDSRAGHVLVSSDTTQLGQLTALDLRSRAVLWTTPVGEAPVAAALDERSASALVVNRNGGTVTVVDANNGQIHCTLTIGGQPLAIIVDSTTHRAFVAAAKQNRLFIARSTCSQGAPRP